MDLNSIREPNEKEREALRLFRARVGDEGVAAWLIKETARRAAAIASNYTADHSETPRCVEIAGRTIRIVNGDGNAHLEISGPQPTKEEQPTPTEFQNFTAMLSRLFVGHGLRDDYEKGWAVLVEIEEEIVEFQFDPNGELKAVLWCDDDGEA